ncbi:MAG: peptidase S8 and S53, subtilisin, kexin, sedolisin [Candidatus Magasanikbacteria bacterium GW2011_GWA2_45_39]|uniref:Peptidase S8 and S53, subtilisin, kexin, sedolisin n=2 Tax=Candidatus Magasanikiibacteriota TaxID=1752731 RepID=A0A0G1QVG6_9BACT|nr:MAG: peptidase S8 and S53, subtilisin, kexin, sedolisin [Candidatus Magasanikbacteria bacterium GW2011_GWA2_45_39]KKU12635.1 MAG: peptidase S8 and S53, subtilisin, kexin, sedolisin [Candidatus Magasanikbacteria bacterium GW2011_GWC2_45_8]
MKYSKRGANFQVRGVNVVYYGSMRHKKRFLIHSNLYLLIVAIFFASSALIGFPASLVRAAAPSNTPNDPNFSEQTYLRQIHATEAWSITKGSKRVVVALIDSGVEFVHPDLQENIWTNPAEQLDGVDNDGNGLIDDIHGWDFVENKSNPGPDFNAPKNDLGFHHGTIVAGIIGAVGNNGTAGTGINWQVSIMPLRALNGVGDTGNGDPTSVVKAVNYAISHKVDVINMSFIGKKLGQDLINAIRRAYEAGITVVAAAGNEGNGNMIDGDLDLSPRYPVCLDGPQGEPWWVIGVAAVDETNRKAHFSGYGTRCVDISAPGVHIPSTLVVHPAEQGFNQLFGGSFSGTSLAAPQVTATVALMKSLKPDLTPKQIYDILIETAYFIDDVNPLYPNALGAGLLNTGAAVVKVRNMISVQSIWFASAGSPIVAQLDGNGVIQKKFTFNYGKQIGVAFARSQSASGIQPLIITGTSNTSSQVRMFDDKGTLKSKGFLAYPKDYNGGIQIAVGDTDGDGEDEIVVVPARRYKPEVRVYSLSGILKNKFLAYASGARLGLSVALADIDGDGRKDIVTGVREGGSAHIRMFNGSGDPLNAGFFAAASTYRGGVNIAAVDTDGDGRAEIITVPLNAAGSPTVRLFGADGVLRRTAPLVYEKNSQFAVAAGDVDRSGDLAIIVARTGTRPGFQRFNANLEPADPIATNLSAKDFRGAPSLVIAP